MNYLIATNRRWSLALVENLTRRTGETFLEINNTKDLNADALNQIQPQLIFFPFWSDYIPPDVYENYECIVFHMTDLPYGRGGSPLQNLIVRGFKETKVSALRCCADVDAGPVYAKAGLSLAGSAREIYCRTADVIEDMIVRIIKDKPNAQPQQGEIVEFMRRKPEESNICGLNNLLQIYDHIRMLDADGYPHAFIDTQHLRIEFTNANYNGDEVTANVSIKVIKNV